MATSKEILLTSAQIMGILNQALDRICEGKAHLYFISDLDIKIEKGKLMFQMEWGEMTKSSDNGDI